jgi:transcriptional regulator with XRE-family HTH domain
MSANVLQFVAMNDAPNRIRELRMAAHLSQQALGDSIGVSKMTISDLERGNMKLDIEYMTRIAKALGVAAVDLLPPSANPWALSDEERSLIEKFRMASTEQREQVQRVADVLLPFRAQPRDAA